GEQLGRAVGRAVVDDDELEVGEPLRQHAAHRLAHHVSAVVRRNDHRHPRHRYGHVHAKRTSCTWRTTGHVGGSARRRSRLMRRVAHPTNRPTGNAQRSAEAGRRSADSSGVLAAPCVWHGTWTPRRAMRHLAAALACLTLLMALVIGAPAPTVAQTNVTGQWTVLSNTMPINPIHVGLMHTGKILVVAGSENDPTKSTYRAGVYNPSTGTIAVQTTP